MGGESTKPCTWFNDILLEFSIIPLFTISKNYAMLLTAQNTGPGAAFGQHCQAGPY